MPGAGPQCARVPAGCRAGPCRSVPVDPVVGPARGLALAQLRQQVDVPAEGEERQDEHVEQHRRRRGGSEEQRARRGHDQQEEHVRAAPTNVSSGIDPALRRLRVTIHVGLAMMRSARVAVAAERRRRTGLGRARRASLGGSGATVQRGLAMMRMHWTAGGGRALQWRLGQRSPHAQCSTARRGGALQGVELTTEVGDRRVRAVLDPRTQHRGNQHGCPGSGDDEEDELSHGSASSGRRGGEADVHRGCRSDGTNGVRRARDNSTTFVTTYAMIGATSVTSTSHCAPCVGDGAAQITRGRRPARRRRHVDTRPIAHRSSPRGRAPRSPFPDRPTCTCRTR